MQVGAGMINARSKLHPGALIRCTERLDPELCVVEITHKLPLAVSYGFVISVLLGAARRRTGGRNLSISSSEKVISSIRCNAFWANR